MKSPQIRIVFIYLIFGLLWISLSDKILILMVQDIKLAVQLQTYKGWLFILITALILYNLVKQNIANHLKIESKVIEKTTNYEEIYNNTTDAIFVHDYETFEILDVNKSAETMYGYDKSELLNMNVSTITVNDEFHNIEKALFYLNEVKEKKLMKFEWHAVKKNGETLWTENIIKTAVINNKKTILVFCRDISKRRLAQLESERKTSFLNAVVKQAPMGIQIVEGTKEKYEVTYTNKEAEKILGGNESDFKNIKVENSVINNKEEVTWTGYRKDGTIIKPEEFPGALIMAGKVDTYDDELIVKRNNGEKTFVMVKAAPVKDQNNNLLGVVVVFPDITELKNIQKELKDSESRYQSLVELAPEAIVTYDAEINKFIDFNLNAEKLFGYSSEELKNMSYLDLSAEIQPDGSDSYDLGKEYIEKALNGEVCKFEWVHLNKKKEKIWCEIVLTKMPGVYDKIIRGTILDKRHIKDFEIKLEKLNHNLKIKNEELEQVVYVTSHDLRTPIVNIEGFSSELKDSLQYLKSLFNNEEIPDELLTKVNSLIDEEITEDIDIIIGNTKKMAVMLKGLLQVSRVGRSNLSIENIDVEKMLADIKESLKYRLREKNAELIFDNLPNCIADKMQLIQVFNNLIDNALKYSSSERDCKIKIAGKVNNEKSIFCIEDNGTGINEKDQKKIFEIFYRINPTDKKEGVGLGLNIISKILEKLDGRIWVESKIDQGSKFFIELPH